MLNHWVLSHRIPGILAAAMWLIGAPASRAAEIPAPVVAAGTAPAEVSRLPSGQTTGEALTLPPMPVAPVTGQATVPAPEPVPTLSPATVPTPESAAAGPAAAPVAPVPPADDPFSAKPERAAPNALGYVPNTMSQSVPDDFKKATIQNMLRMVPFSLRDLVGMLATKARAKPGLSFDEVVESMKIRANERNFKLVGHNALWRDVVAIGGKPSFRVEIFSFCDAIIARKILDYAPEFVIFLPCRFAVMEDSHGDIWIVTMDWDVTWMDASMNPHQIPVDLREDAIRLRATIDEIVKAAASGEL